MASATVKRDISTIFLLVLFITGAVFGLPLAEVDGENRDGQIAQPDGQHMFPADMPPPPPGAFNDPGPGVLPPSKLPEPPSGDVAPLSNNGLAVNPPVEAAGVAGTGLAMMAGPVVPGSNTGDMFPDNVPPPPARALDDVVPAQGQVVPANNGAMFPVNMPPPPQGAVNDMVPAQGQVVPADTGAMFPVNMPPPPEGAVNDAVLDMGQLVPVNNGDMFPDNMPPPPPGAFNDGVAPPTIQEIAPRENEVNQDDIVPPNKKVASPPHRGMFPPNMPPPPPGAFNDPPPVPKLSEKKVYAVVPSVGTAVGPTNVSGINVPDRAVVPPSDQNPYILPNQKSSLPSNQQYVATANGPSNAPQYEPDTAVSNDPNTPYSQPEGNPQALSPNTQDNPGEGQAPYNPDDLDAPNQPSPSGNNQRAESFPNQNEAVAPVNLNVPEANPSQPAAPNQNLPTGSDAGGQNPDNVNENPSESLSTSTSESSYESFDESSYEEEQNKVNGDSQEWSPEASDTFSEEVVESVGEYSESESDYSFLNYMESSVESSDYESIDFFNGGEGAPENSWEDSESEAFAEVDDSSYLEESSEYSDLDWLVNGGSSMDAGTKASDAEEVDYFGRDQTQETGSHEEGQKQTFPDDFRMEDDMYRTGGTKLIMYCIPALILCVLILLAWKNYRGRIRVVSVLGEDTKQYDWKTDHKSEEHAPMLLDQDQEERGY